MHIVWTKCTCADKTADRGCHGEAYNVPNLPEEFGNLYFLAYSCPKLSTPVAVNKKLLDECQCRP